MEKEAKMKITLETLYKTLKKHDAAILKNFNNPGISDEFYFFNAINSDIMSNGLGIVVNLLCGNVDSIGVDQNCRSLLEAFVILRMRAENAIGDDQMKLYRYQYALVEKDNFSSRLSDEVKKNSSEWKHLENDCAIAKGLLCKIYGVDAAGLHSLYRPKKGKPKIALDDPNLYLKSRPTFNINFMNLMEKYPVLGPDTKHIYNFFSLFIHPRFEKDVSVESAFLDLRQKHIEMILNYLSAYLAEAKLFVFDESESGFKEDFQDNPILVNNRYNIKQIDYAFCYLAKQLCSLKEGTDAYTLMLLGQIRGLMLDFAVSESLGYREHIVGKFKPFMEYFAVSILLNSANSLEEFRAKKLAFCYSSRLQVIEYMKQFVDMEEMNCMEEYIRSVYDCYYKNAYQVDFDTFYHHLIRNSLYFISSDRKSYNAIVKNAIEKLLPSQDVDLAKHLYKLSKDMSHASGYNFNSTKGIADYYCRLAIAEAWQMIIQYISFAKITLEEHDHNVDIMSIIDMFRTIRDAEFEEANKEQRKSMKTTGE